MEVSEEEVNYLAPRHSSKSKDKVWQLLTGLVGAPKLDKLQRVPRAVRAPLPLDVFSHADRLLRVVKLSRHDWHLKAALFVPVRLFPL